MKLPESTLNQSTSVFHFNQSTFSSLDPANMNHVNQSEAVLKGKGSIDALLYIIIVLLFYAFSIVVLMVKYIRREKEEAHLREYYHEYVSRDKFHSPHFQNRVHMNKLFSKNNLTLTLTSTPRSKGDDDDDGLAQEAEGLLQGRETPV